MLICLPCVILQEMLEKCRMVRVEGALGRALLRLPAVPRSLPVLCGGARQGPQRRRAAAGWEEGWGSACSLQSSQPNSLHLSRLVISFTSFLLE